MTGDLKGKKVLVTGASSGMLATVETFARLGATVALNYLPNDPRGASEIVDRLNKEGLSVRGAPGAVSQVDEVQSMVQETIRTFGGLDCLPANGIRPAPRHQAHAPARAGDCRPKARPAPASRRVPVLRDRTGLGRKARTEMRRFTASVTERLTGRP
jgi:NAD(P)-dependent dehydrogenase (short-subunit alcohol dehydrogenase family)